MNSKQTIPYHHGCLQLERVAVCTLCGARDLDPKFEVRHIAADPLHCWATEQGYTTATVARCRRCGLLFKTLRPRTADLNRYYAQLDEKYMERVAEKRPTYREDYRVARKVLATEFPHGGSILDVGCATGVFLDTLGEKWSRHGLELFHLAAQRAKASGQILVRECDIFSAGFPTASFDVVCSFDVVEHLAKPMDFFREARRILKPSGLLILGTGDAGSFTARLTGYRWTYVCIPEHISFFSARSVKIGLREAGFSRVETLRIHHGEKHFTVATGWLRAAGKHWAVTLFGENVMRLSFFRSKTSGFLVPYFFDHMICVAR